MNFFEILPYRTSTRKFTEEQISAEQLEKILYAGKMAPIGSSRYENIHITVVQDKNVLFKLAEAARVRHADLKEMAQIIANVANRDELLSKELDFDSFYGAPTVIFVSHKRQTLEPGIEFADVAGVVNLMHLAALDLGLGSCFMWYALDSMRRFPEHDQSKLLNLPKDFEPLLGLAVGNPLMPLTVRETDPDKIGVDYI